MKYLYIVDTKLFAYHSHQRGGQASDMFNHIANTLVDMPKGRIIFAGDVGKSSYRTEEQPWYKGHRRKDQTPEEIKKHKLFSKEYQICLDLVRHTKATLIAPTGVEADDVASIIEEKYRGTDTKVVFLTNDRDWLFSTLGSDTELHTLDGQILDSDYVQMQYEVSNQRDWLLLKAMAGDSGDNLLGPVKFFGATKATAALRECTDLDCLASVMEVFLNKDKRAHLRPEFEDKTIKGALESNLLIARPFTSYDMLTKKQHEQFVQQITRPKTANLTKFFNEAIDELGYPIMLNDSAQRVYG